MKMYYVSHCDSTDIAQFYIEQLKKLSPTSSFKTDKCCLGLRDFSSVVIYASELLSHSIVEEAALITRKKYYPHLARRS